MTLTKKEFLNQAQNLIKQNEDIDKIHFIESMSYIYEGNKNNKQIENWSYNYSIVRGLKNIAVVNYWKNKK